MSTYLQLCNYLFYFRKLEPDVFFGLSSLEELDLGWNEIKTIPTDVFKPLTDKLKTISLRNNPISELPSTGLGMLEKLSLAECGFTSISADQLKDYPKLEELDLSKCNISNIVENTFENQKDSLKKLNLQKNKLKSLPNVSSVQKLLKLRSNHKFFSLLKICQQLSHWMFLRIHIDATENWLIVSISVYLNFISPCFKSSSE